MAVLHHRTVSPVPKNQSIEEGAVFDLVAEYRSLKKAVQKSDTRPFMHEELSNAQIKRAFNTDDNSVKRDLIKKHGLEKIMGILQ